jgi:SAM-dependent methyltransferase
VKLSHKIGKLFSREAYTRAARRIDREFHPIPLPPLLDKIDKVRLRELQERHAAARNYPAKYVRDIPRYLRMNIPRVQDLHLHRLPQGAAVFNHRLRKDRRSGTPPPVDILDLGCGGGFFLFIAQQYGHRCLGLDMPDHPLFGELCDLLGVQRRVWKIQAMEPLPDLGRKFDLITAFSIGFNRKADKSLWNPDEWDFFLRDLQDRHLKPGGKIFLAMNPQLDGEFYSEDVRDFFLKRGAQIERERVLFG